MGFFARQIDDPATGWKGRALWATSGNRTPFHIEGIDAPIRVRRERRMPRGRARWWCSCVQARLLANAR